jgi:hypothetical protein
MIRAHRDVDARHAVSDGIIQKGAKNPASEAISSYLFLQVDVKMGWKRAQVRTETLTMASKIAGSRPEHTPGFSSKEGAAADRA